jgi:hypothetical protein
MKPAVPLESWTPPILSLQAPPPKTCANALNILSPTAPCLAFQKTRRIPLASATLTHPTAARTVTAGKHAAITESGAGLQRMGGRVIGTLAPRPPNVVTRILMLVARAVRPVAAAVKYLKLVLKD